jgi:hypothetical protein
MEISVIYNFLKENYPDKATYSLARKCKRELDKAGEKSITPQARTIIAAVVNHA